MLNIKKRVNELHGVSADKIPDEVFTSTEPVILRGLIKQWPFVQAGLESDEGANAYLRRFYIDKTVGAYYGEPEIAGRFFYTDDFGSFNFERQRPRLDHVLDSIFQHKANKNPPSFYVGSTTVDSCLPGFRTENDLSFYAENPLVSIWIGNQSRIACHYDAPDNIACVAVGKRRFTLFPSDQVANLYPGPLDMTPAGQAISLVDFSNPDFEKFPRFKIAIEHGFIAELDAGDALFLPGMWWHHVEALSEFNVLVNYWWRNVPDYMGPAVNALKHAMLGIRDLPEHEKAAWKHLFDYYIFGDAKNLQQHIPENAQGCLAPMDDMNARQLRAWLINKLNR